MGRVSVKQADPEFAFQGIEFAQQRAQTRGFSAQVLRGSRELFRCSEVATVSRPQIQPVIGGVLRNKIQLLHPFGDELASFGYDIALGPAAMGAAHTRDDAKTAGMIAALGNFKVSEMRRSQSISRRRDIGNETGAMIHLQQRRTAGCRGTAGGPGRSWGGDDPASAPEVLLAT